MDFQLILNTLIIASATLVLAIIISFISSYILTFYDFKLKGIFSYIVILPLAIPSYVMGYIYSDIFMYTFLNFHIDILNIYGVIFILTISLYPYIYLVIESYMSKINYSLIEASLILNSKLKMVTKIIFPLSIVPIVLGSLLMLMEVLNAYGLPSYFGVKVFSTEIYKEWTSYYSFSNALKLSLILLFIIILIYIFANILLVNYKKFSYSVINLKKIKVEKIKSTKLILVNLWVIFISNICFIIPLIKLISWIRYSDYIFNFIVIFQSLYIALISSIIIIILSLLFTVLIRYRKNNIFYRILSSGYSIPGVIISVIILNIFLYIDNAFKLNFLFSLTIIPLIVAYIIRFLAISNNTIQSSMYKIGNKYYETSLVLGKSKLYTLIFIDIPLLKNAIFSAFILVFIEIIKELPMTSMLLSFNYKTLAIVIKAYTDQEKMANIAYPSLMIILISSILLVIYKRMRK